MRISGCFQPQPQHTRFWASGFPWLLRAEFQTGACAQQEGRMSWLGRWARAQTLPPSPVWWPHPRGCAGSRGSSARGEGCCLSGVCPRPASHLGQGTGSTSVTGSMAHQDWLLHKSFPSAPPPLSRPSWPRGPPSQATLTSLHNGRLIAGTHGQHLEHTAGGPEQLLVTVVTHDLHEGLGSSVGQDDELRGDSGK